MQKMKVEGYELSPQQKELWRAIQGGTVVDYAVRCEVRVEGGVDRIRLQQAVSEVLRRHEVLRTRYEQVAELSYPLQIIGSDVTDGVEVNWSERAGATMLTLEVSALSGDRLSLRNLVGEIAAAYAAPEQAPAPLFQYADLAQWQNELLASEETRGGREHWRTVEVAAAPHPALVFARDAAPGCASYLTFDLPAVTHARMAEFCRQQGVTPKALLLTTWATLLSRLSAQCRLRLYLITDGRRHEEIASAVGLFARRLPLALEVEGRFVDVLAAVTEQLETAEKWQEYYETDQETAGGEYGFEFYEPPVPIEVAGLCFKITSERVRLWRPQLNVSIGWDGEGALTGHHDRTSLELEYDAAAFTAADVRRLGEEYATLLGSALEKSEAPVGELEDRRRTRASSNSCPC